MIWLSFISGGIADGINDTLIDGKHELMIDPLAYSMLSGRRKINFDEFIEFNKQHALGKI